MLSLSKDSVVLEVIYINLLPFYLFFKHISKYEYSGLLRYQVDFAAQECDFSDDDFDLDDYWNGFHFSYPIILV